MASHSDYDIFDVPEPWQPLRNKVKHAKVTTDLARKWMVRTQILENIRKTKRDANLDISEDAEIGGATGGKPGETRPEISCGMVVFKDVHENDLEGQPYLCIAPESPITEVGSLLEYEWKITIPTIVLGIISGIENHGHLLGTRQWANFQEGIVNAANKTNMWIVTHGLNIGMGRAIGDVIHKETVRRKTMTCSRHPKQSALKLPKITLMGIVKSDYLRYGDHLDGKAFVTEVTTEGNNPKESKYELNPYHTHFIVVKDQTMDHSVILQFVLKLGRYLRTLPNETDPESEGTSMAATVGEITEAPPDFSDVKKEGHLRKSSLSEAKIPMIGLLIGGGYRSTQMVAQYLKNRIPVVVVKGSGCAADLLAFAYEEVKEKNRGSWDPDYVENFIMSELSKKIAISFAKYRENNLARNKFRDKIMECVMNSHKDERVFLDFLDIHSSKCDLSLLNEHLLRAMFKSEKQEESDNRWKFNMHRDVFLSLDWNCPHICDSEIFRMNTHKYKIEPRTFELALLRHGREAFIDLFLEQGFQVCKYLTKRRLCRLFERAENQDFFRTVTLEGALGFTLIKQLDAQPMIRELNWMIYKMTKIKNFLNLPDLSMSSVANPFSLEDQSHVFERRAQNALIVWAVLMNRPKLAQVLWKRAAYPVHLAIMISMLYDKLVSYAYEKHLIKELEDLSSEFAQMAVGVLDASFQAGNCRAFDVLSEEVSDFNYKTAVEMAAMANNRRFIAHPCCQKWLTSMFYGDIRTRDLKYGFLTVPSWLKIILSAFFFLPMNIWVVFQPKSSQGEPLLYGYEDLLMESELGSEVGSLSRSALERRCTIEGSRPAIHLSLVDTFRDIQQTQESQKSLSLQMQPRLLGHRRENFPFWKKIATLWNAPITKFWTHQIFYVLYLTLFSVAVLWPSCGYFSLDIALWFWTLLILFEDMLITYMHYKNYSSIRLVSGLSEIILIFVFLITFMFVRILPANETVHLNMHVPRVLIQGYGARIIMCLGMLYFFYRFIWIYFPISPTLGRLLYRIKLMVMQDFMHFLRIALLFIVSSGIAVHSVIYPDYPMSLELIRRVFHRSFFTMFFSGIDDLQGDASCSAFPYKGPDTCRASPYASVTCPVTGVWPYLMIIEYFVILKLILITLLFALFSDTASKLAADADAIWRYQRYHLVLDFYVRPRLPAPLNIFSFLIMFVRMMIKCCRCQYNFRKRPKDGVRKSQVEGEASEGMTEDFYWRGLAVAYLLQQQEKAKEGTLQMQQMNRLHTINDSLEYQKSVMQGFKVRINELEKLMLSSRISLEEIRHVLNWEDEKFSVTKTHLLARQSPYLDTKIKRFPLADRYVPWEVLYSVYDPVVYSKPKSEYVPLEVQEYVDEDLLQIAETDASFSGLDLQWNCHYINSVGVAVNRGSWMRMDDGKPLHYKLDSNSLPQNPMGRTGLRGRGCLYRWGPNHAIYVVITRWRFQDSFLQSVQHAGASHDDRILEVMMRSQARPHLTLPGGFENGERSPYDAVKRIFLPNQMTEPAWDAAAMFNYFIEATQTSITDFTDVVRKVERVTMENNVLFRGYVDDSRNTDNAWIEAEVWFFHCTGDKTIDIATLDLRWKKYSPNVLAKMIPSHAAILRDVHQKIESG